jgi:cell division protein FtsQ
MIGLGRSRGNRRRRTAKAPDVAQLAERKAQRQERWRARAQVAGRVALTSGKLGLVLGAAALVAVGVWQVRRFILTSPRFALKEVQVIVERPEGTAASPLPGAPGAGLKTAEVVKRLSTPAGTNMFRIDAQKAAREAAGHPWVRSASAKKRFPGKLEITVQVREPRAVAALSGLYLVDEQGEAFKRLLPGEDPGLVLITGISREDYVADPGESQARIREAMTAASDYQAHRPAQLGPVEEINIDEDWKLTLRARLGGQGSDPAVPGPGTVSVRMGRGQRLEKLQRLAQALVALGDDGSRVREVRLDHVQRAERVVVALREEAGQRPATP